MYYDEGGSQISIITAPTGELSIYDKVRTSEIITLSYSLTFVIYV
jgi:hypothetical protein